MEMTSPTLHGTILAESLLSHKEFLIANSDFVRNFTYSNGIQFSSVGKLTYSIVVSRGLLANEVLVSCRQPKNTTLDLTAGYIVPPAITRKPWLSCKLILDMTQSNPLHYHAVMFIVEIIQ